MCPHGRKEGGRVRKEGGRVRKEGGRVKEGGGESENILYILRVNFPHREQCTVRIFKS